jgi:maltose O-acetyltransferase
MWRICGVTIGRDVQINLGCRIFGTGPIEIGADTWVGIDTTFVVPLGGRVSIGHACDIAPDVLFHCGSHRIGDPKRRAGAGYSGEINIGSGTWIGSRATLLAGVEVGAGCIVAAGAVVTAGTYPAQSLLAGVPARVVRRLDEEDRRESK